MTALKSPTRISHGIRSSYELEHTTPWTQLAAVREIPVPSHVVESKRGVLRAVWTVVTP